jgi:hypothetical protein
MSGNFERLAINASVQLPEAFSHRTWKRVFTGEEFRTEKAEVTASCLFAGVPLGLLTAT